MSTNQISFKYTSVSPNAAKKLAETVEKILRAEFYVAKEKLIDESPVGASAENGQRSLKDSWYLIVKRKNKDVSIQIGNRAPRALNRLEGRKAGKRPPTVALIPWVMKTFGVDRKRAIFIAYRIAKKIGEQGTERSKRSFRQFDPKTGKPAKNSYVDQAIRKSKKLIAEIAISKL